MGHNSNHGCKKYSIVGCNRNHRVASTDLEQHLSPVVDDDFSCADKPYIETILALVRVNTKLITQFPPNPLH